MLLLIFRARGDPGCREYPIPGVGEGASTRRSGAGASSVGKREIKRFVTLGSSQAEAGVRFAGVGRG